MTGLRLVGGLVLALLVPTLLVVGWGGWYLLFAYGRGFGSAHALPPLTLREFLNPATLGVLFVVAMLASACAWGAWRLLSRA